MAIVFPTTLDTLTNPISTDTTTAVDHAVQHANANSAIIALETRVGVTGSAVASTLTNRIATLETAFVTQGAWTSYAPTLTQGVGVTFTNTESRYAKVGRIVSCSGRIAPTSAGTAASVITLTLPLTAASSVVRAIGTHYVDAAGTPYSGVVLLASTTTMLMITHATTSGGLGASPAWTIPSSAATISWTVTYETAS